MVSTTLAALRHAETKHGRPVYVIEVYESWREISYKPIIHFAVFTTLTDLYRNDELLVVMMTGLSGGCC